jgi:DNA-binding response OmpR family regulator
MLHQYGPMVILIVEDEILIGLGLSLVLSMAGHRVLGPASSVRRALAIAAREPPDLAFVDVDLEGDADGLEAARELHGRHDTTVVFLTADPQRARAARDIALGVIAKPYDPQTPLRAVELAADARAGRPLTRVPRDLELFA